MKIGLSEMEIPFYEVRNLAMAARMMASADAMPKDAGAAQTRHGNSAGTARLREPRCRSLRVIARAAAGSNMPVIPPPGSPGGDPTIRPK